MVPLSRMLATQLCSGMQCAAITVVADVLSFGFFTVNMMLFSII